MSGNWTPGPWRYDPVTFTSVWGPNDEHVHYTQNGPHAAKNAQLIAAAPDLYVALTDALQALEQFVDTSAEARKPYEHPLSAYDRGQDALAKARGETK